MASLYNKKFLNYYTTTVINEISLSSCPLNFRSSNNQSVGNASLIPTYGLPCNDENNITSLEGSANELRAKQRREGGGVAVPLYASEQDRGSKGVGESKPSPQPSPIGEGVICHPELVSGSCDMLRCGGQSDIHNKLNHRGQSDVQHDANNFQKTTYSKNRIIPLTLTLSRKGRGKSSSPFTLYPSLKKHCAFTLAEVLITLGIIGVAAALTMPVLIANHKKQVTVTRMQKFYTTINQAVKLSEVVNGTPEYWQRPEASDGASLNNFWNTYMAKYFSVNDVMEVSDGIVVKIADGSAFGVYMPDADKDEGFEWLHIVYCVDYKSCAELLENSGNSLFYYPLDGKNTFLFRGHKNGIVPYGSNSGYSREQLRNGGNYGYACSGTYKAYCAALIEYDGWKISKDYPVRF